jgi:hypothetical protein
MGKVSNLLSNKATKKFHLEKNWSPKYPPFLAFYGAGLIEILI